MTPHSFPEWVKMMSQIGWALFRSYLYQCRNPLNYRVVTKSEILFKEGEGFIQEDVSFVGVVRDIPDVTDHSVIHKWRLVKTFYGEWEE